MRNGKIKQAIFKCLLNYRIIFAYFMATMFFFMHYFVTTSEFVAVANDRSVVNSINIPNDNLNSKKLLNFDANYELPKRIASSVFDGSVKPKRQRHRGRLNQLLNSRVVVNKLVIDEPTSADYNLKNESIYYSQILQDRILMSLLNRTNSSTENGIFVEAGAYDGETWSNTLHLERYHNWTGLLIEPSPENYHQLRSKNRKAYSINSCLCGGDYSLKSSFIEAGPFGTIAGASTESSSNRRLTCHPLVKILDEFYNLLNRSGDDSERLRIVDYLSLDIEGNERTVIETFPFETRYRFNFINIEYNQNREVYEWLKMHLGRFGYRETFVDDVWSQDVYLAHESVFNNGDFLLSKVSEFDSNTI